MYMYRVLRGASFASAFALAMAAADFRDAVCRVSGDELCDLIGLDWVGMVDVSHVPVLEGSVTFRQISGYFLSPYAECSLQY